ncbi:ABC transporter permease [Bacillus sp. Hm123]|uniref:ABC transporter permease n=1 Tax=Bacillus sp. Hm123 TaxID=3450745 RepID=UPI003F420985
MIIGAIKNELEKLYWKKRMHAIIGIILFFSALMITINFFDKDTGSSMDWKGSTKEGIVNIENHLSTIENKSSQEYIELLNQKNKLTFHLENNINPEHQGASGMTTSSVEGIFIKLILPLLIAIITADIVSGETSNGTMKSMLVRPIGRKGILIAKYSAALIISIGAMLLSDLLTYFTSIPFYGLGSWNDLIVVGDENFKAIPLWEYMMYGLALNIITILTLISVFILVSILFESVATTVSLSISIILFGGLLANLQSQLDFLKYFFVLNLDLASHITGEFSAQNTSLSLSLIVMVMTAFIASCLAFARFTKKGMLI